MNQNCMRRASQSVAFVSRSTEEGSQATEGDGCTAEGTIEVGLLLVMDAQGV